MMDKAFYGRLKASAEKRYKSFVSTVADYENVWMLRNKQGYVAAEDDGLNYLVWPTKEFAELFSNGNEVTSIEVHQFCEWCIELANSSGGGFAVFPNGEDSTIVTAKKLLSDISDELERIE